MYEALNEPAGNQDRGERQTFAIERRIGRSKAFTYDFMEPDANGRFNGKDVSDQLVIQPFEVRFFSGDIPQAVITELNGINYKSTAVEHPLEGSEATFALFKFSMDSTLRTEGPNTESDRFSIETQLRNTNRNDPNFGRPASFSTTMTGSTEGTRQAYENTLPKQAIEFFESSGTGATLSDVVIIDPISFKFISDTESTATSPGEPQRGDIEVESREERLRNITGFEISATSDAATTPEASTVLSFGGMLALGGLACWRSQRRRQAS